MHRSKGVENKVELFNLCYMQERCWKAIHPSPYSLLFSSNVSLPQPTWAGWADLIADEHVRLALSPASCQLVTAYSCRCDESLPKIKFVPLLDLCLCKHVYQEGSLSWLAVLSSHPLRASVPRQFDRTSAGRICMVLGQPPKNHTLHSRNLDWGCISHQLTSILRQIPHNGLKKNSPWEGLEIILL